VVVLILSAVLYEFEYEYKYCRIGSNGVGKVLCYDTSTVDGRSLSRPDF